MGKNGWFSERFHAKMDAFESKLTIMIMNGLLSQSERFWVQVNGLNVLNKAVKMYQTWRFQVYPGP